MICLAIPDYPTGELRNQWDFVLSNFAVDRVLHLPLKDMVEDCQLVVLAPRAGRFIQGEVSLREYRHPDKALYLFGSDKEHLHPDVLCDAPSDRVFIPTATHHEMYSHVAAAVVLWDRMLKHG